MRITIVSLILILSYFSSFEQNRENIGKMINSEYSEVNPIISPDGKSLYFVRINHPDNEKWEEYNECCWFSKLDTNLSWKMAEKMPKEFNLSATNSILSVTPDGNTFLIRGAYENGVLVSKGYSFIYREKYGWSLPEKLNIRFYEDMDIGEYSGAFLSNNGQTIIMYFSEKYNGKLCNLYFSHLQKNGIWSKPKKLGKTINGKRTDEISPFLASDGRTLYFSSNRENGFGSYDIYMSRRNGDDWTHWTEPKNIGNGINTEEWDAYYSISAKGDNAFMTSTDKSYGKEDIIIIPLKKEVAPDPVVLLSGVVYDAKTKKPLSAKIRYELLPQGESEGIARSNPDDGSYKIILSYGKKFGINATVEGYFPVSENFDLTNISEYKEITRNLEMVPVMVGHTVRMNNIFFDFGKSILTPNSYPELNRVVKLMNENPEMEIEISGHTDNVGSNSFNLKLSDERANAVRTYLIEHKINANRIKAKGYGKNRPVASNDTDDGKQKNRRVEFTILKK